MIKIFKFENVSGPRVTKWPRAKEWGRCLAEGWDKGEGIRGWGGGLGQGGEARAWVGGALVKT